MDPSPNPSSAAEPEPLPNYAHIDETWIASCEMVLKQNMILCPVCYTLPIDCAVECAKCERIFCKQCFDKISQVQNAGDKKCPNCKVQPWKRKDDIHISYKHMFDSLRFRCKICQESETSKDQLMESEQMEAMTKDDLRSHLEKKHNLELFSHATLYDFVVIPQQGEEIKLSWMQNLEINYKKSLDLEDFQIGGPKGKIYKIYLKDMKCYHSSFGQYKLKYYKSQTLQKNKEYIIWIVNLYLYNDDDGPLDYMQQDSFQEPNGQLNENQKNWEIFYSEEYQPIIEKHYQEFLQKPNFNVFCLDSKKSRYIINFKNKKQINSCTNNKQNIKRLSLILK